MVMRPLAQKCARRLYRLSKRNHLAFWYYRLFKSGQTFRLGDHEYEYLHHRRNATWTNERAIELPIAWDYVTRYRGRRILEVGNVLSHYFPTSHDVVDKYEKSPGVINEDIAEFSPQAGYDLIVTVSTLEHVGWDEPMQDAEKIPHTLERLRQFLNPGGSLVVTVPLGYNQHLDQHLKTRRIRFADESYLKRISPDNRWREVSREEAAAVPFGFLHANAMLIGVDRADSAA